MTPESPITRDNDSPIAQALLQVLDVDDQRAVLDIATSLQSWLDGSKETASILDAPLRRLAKLADGRLNTLAELQSKLVALMGNSSSEAGEYRRCSILLAALARAFDEASPMQPRSSKFSLIADSREFLQQLIDAIGDPVFVKDEQHRWVLSNQAFADFMGHSIQELLGKSDYEFVPEEQADIFWEKDNLVLSTGASDENEETVTDADGREHRVITKKTRLIDSRGNKYVVAIIRDITDRKQLEARLDVAQRLVSLGTLASGLAHEINNPLSFVLTNLDYLLESLDEPDETREDRQGALEAAIRGAERVHEVIDGLSTFSDISDEELGPVDLNECIQSTVRVAANDIEQRAELIEDYGDLPPIEGDSKSLDQVVLNLLINANDALEPESPQENQVCVRTFTGSDGEAVVEISDTGQGIRPDIQDQIFDPFFTTKPVGEGTGLGLSICHSLVEAMNGRIEMESKPQRGTTFRLVFPPLNETHRH